MWKPILKCSVLGGLIVFFAQCITRPDLFVGGMLWYSGSSMLLFFAGCLLSIIWKMMGAGLISFLLIRSKIDKYWAGVWFVVAINLIALVLTSFPRWDWGLHATTWFLAGLVIAKFSKNYASLKV